MSIPDKYKVDHLFLLVGENPLPNYVAARTLLNDGGTVYLVFTKQTIPQKNCLRGIDGLHKYGIKCVEVDLANYESNAYHICSHIQQRLNSLNGGSVGINYTGGTKAMAVHAYRAIQEKEPNAVFSYLDSRTLKMWLDQKGNRPIHFDVNFEPSLNLEKLFRLHNNNYWLDNQPPCPEPFLADIAAKFADFHSNDDRLAKEWRSWCKYQLHPKTKNGDYWKKEPGLNCSPPISITLEGLSPSIKNILQQELKVSTTHLQLGDIKKKKGFDSLTHVCEWLDGTWLESYVLQQVKGIQDEFGIKESMMSFHIRDSRNNWRERFEFDVAFIKGYQLFAISCTTSGNKARCKQKLFEAHLRARQLGGDEARVALVCCFDKPEWIKDDVRFAIPDKKIEVFGRQDLANLADGIADWIDRNNQEAKV